MGLSLQRLQDQRTLNNNNSVCYLLAGPWTSATEFVFLSLFSEMNCPPFSIFSSFISSQYLLFLKSSRSHILFLPTSMTSVICPSVTWRQFLPGICPIQLAFLYYCLEELSSFSSMFKYFISYFPWPFYFLNFSPASHFASLEILSLQFS